MSGEVNVLSRTQIIKVDPVTKSVSVINAGPQGPLGGGGGSTAAAGISVADVAGNFDGTNVEAVLAELAAEGGGGSSAASEISVADVADNFTGTNVEAVLAELYGLSGSDLTEVLERLALLESIGRFNMDSVDGVVGDGVTDCTAAIQAIIHFFGAYTDPETGAHGVPIRLVFPQPEGYVTDTLDIPYDNIYLEGIGPRRGGLISKNTDAGAPLLHWNGEDAGGSWTQRIEGGGTVNLRLSASGAGGTNNTVAIFCENTTAMTFVAPAWWGFRGAGSLIKGRNAADQYILEPEADFCGNVNPERALFDLGENPGGEWACDRWRIWGGRLENNSGPIVNAISGSHFITKIFMMNTKIENQLTNGNGTGGSVLDGTLFRFDRCLNLELHALDLTVGGLNLEAMLGAPLPSIFDFNNCYGVYAQGCINLGLPGVKPFTSFFKVHEGTGYDLHFRLTSNQEDGSCLPDQVFEWTGDPREVNTAGTYWSYNANSIADGGAGPNLTLADDFGTIGSAQVGYDHKFKTLGDGLFAHILDAGAHTTADMEREWRTDASNDIGDGVSYSFTLTHGLNIPGIYPASILVLDTTTWWPIDVDARGINANQVQIDFPPASLGGAPPGVKAYRVVVVAPRG